MKRALALLAAALALAGCMGGDAAPDATTAAVDAPAAPTDAAAQEAIEDATLEPPAPIETPVAFDGALTNYVVACESATGTVGCQGTPASTTSGWDIPHEGGNLTAFALEMTWTAASPATQTLGMHVFGCAEAEDGSITCEVYASAEGASPLTLAATGLAVPPGQTMRAFAFRPSELPPSPIPGFVYYELEQTFHVEGAVTIQPVP